MAKNQNDITEKGSIQKGIFVEELTVHKIVKDMSQIELTQNS